MPIKAAMDVQLIRTVVAPCLGLDRLLTDSRNGKYEPEHDFFGDDDNYQDNKGKAAKCDGDA